jgi:hypothetical protein
MGSYWWGWREDVRAAVRVLWWTDRQWLLTTWLVWVIALTSLTLHVLDRSRQQLRYRIPGAAMPFSSTRPEGLEPPTF